MLTDLQGEALPEVKQQIRHQSENTESDQTPDHLFAVMLSNRSGDDHAAQPRQSRQLGRPEHRQYQKYIALRALASGVADQTADQAPFQRSKVRLIVVLGAQPPDQRQGFGGGATGIAA